VEIKEARKKKKQEKKRIFYVFQWMMRCHWVVTTGTAAALVIGAEWAWQYSGRFFFFLSLCDCGSEDLRGRTGF